MPTQIRLILVCAIFAVVAAPLSVVAAIPQTPSPEDVVETLHRSLLDVMKNADTLGYDGRLTRLAPTVAETFDQPFMARMTMGRHWKTLSEKAQRHWVGRFSYLTVSNYATRFAGYQGEKFEVLGTRKAPRDTVIVKTRIVLPGDKDVRLDYRLHKTEAGWRIIDVLMNGTVSELALRRSEYKASIRREGFESLLTSVDRKIAAMESKARAADQSLPARIPD